MLLPPFWGNDPRPIRPWRVMADMLGVSAGEPRHPVLHVILKKVDNSLLHRLSITQFPALDRPIPRPLFLQQSAASLAFSSGRCKPLSVTHEPVFLASPPPLVGQDCHARSHHPSSCHVNTDALVFDPTICSNTSASYACRKHPDVTCHARYVECARKKWAWKNLSG